MREIKFRGFSPCFKEWLYGDLIVSDTDVTCVVERGAMKMDGHHIRQFADRPYYVENESIGQFTGLHDKNGKEIYEGDIIDIYDSDYETHDNNEVSFKDGVFGVENWTGNLTTLSFFIKHNGDSEYSIEVVGNVYDNPELLKGNA